MKQLTPNRSPTHVRSIRSSDIRALLRLIDSAWRVHLRVMPVELRTKIDETFGFLATNRGGIQGFLMAEPLPSIAAMIIAASLRDSWSLESYLDLLLPQVEIAARDRSLSALVYVGNASWLIEPLRERGFETREWMMALERLGSEPPPPLPQTPARIRTAHYQDIPTLMALDELVFIQIWHKSLGNFSQALARADSFAVAEIDQQVVAYEWCEVYDKHAHLTRLAVHPDYQGQGIGAQLLHHAITYVLQQEVDLITLNTQEANRRSQTLYQRFGFVDTKQRMPVLWKEL